MSKIKNDIHIYVLVFFAIVILIIAYFHAFESRHKDVVDHFAKLSKGWDIRVDGHNYNDVDLEQLIPKQQNKRSIIEMQLTIPEDIKIKNPVLKMHTYHCGYDVFLDGQYVTHYGILEVARHEPVGMGYNFITMPDDYAGKRLYIRLYVNENNAFTSITPPEIYDSNYLIRDLVSVNIVPLAINLFLLVFGVTVFIISVIFYVKFDKFIKMVYVSVFSFLISIWSICNYDLISLFTYDMSVKANIEYASMFSCAIFILLYFREDVKTAPKWIRYFMNATLLVQIIFTVVSCTFQALNILHFHSMLVTQHIILLFVGANMIIATGYNIKDENKNKKALIIGLSAFIFTAIFDLVKFNMSKYIFTDRVFSYVSMMCIGTLIFIIAQIVDFCKEISAAMTDQMKKDTLKEMAYKDPLTQISNRRRCDEELEALDKTNKVFGIISFDLNNLKKVNDIEGHEKGDLLIRSFAEVLDETYGKLGIVCRMGGDEFTVVFPNMKNVEIDKLDAQLKENIIKKNEMNPGLNISTAYGFCDNSVNREWKSADIYREADKKMYENKIAMKAQRA